MVSEGISGSESTSENRLENQGDDSFSVIIPSVSTPSDEHPPIALRLGTDIIELPVHIDSEGHRSLDIRALRAQTGWKTYDPGLANTGACRSHITYIDGAKGILRYRGISIEELCEKSNFLESSYLTIYGELPTQSELLSFEKRIEKYLPVHEDLKSFVQHLPKEAHPMSNLSILVNALSAYYPDLACSEPTEEQQDESIALLMAQTQTLAAYAYRQSLGEALMPPVPGKSVVQNFVHTMFSTPREDFASNPVIERALDLLLTLHLDHEQNCSTSAVRVIASAKATVFQAITAGIAALSGPLHGGANQAVLEMLESIQNDGGDFKRALERAKDKEDPFRLMGFGHRVYKNYDPRAKIIKGACDELLQALGVKDPILTIAKGLEEAALEDPYFVERKLFPNVDFYSGIIYRALGIPTNMFTVLFALGRLPGWLAHWRELGRDPEGRITRPFQIYDGPGERGYVPVEERGRE